MSSKYNSTKRRFRSSYIISLLSITLVLFVLSLFALLVLYANGISSYIKENVGFEIVMKKGVKEADILKFQKELDGKKYVKSTRYISKEEATQQLSADLGEDILQWLGDVENPLLPSIDVRFTSEYANNDSISKIEEWVLDRKNVKEVYFQKSLINSINNNVNKLGALLLLIGTVLLIMAVTLISNTVRLSVYAKRFIVRSMQLVGATREFIMKPFLKTFVIQGVIGAAISLVFLSVFLAAMMDKIPELRLLTNTGGIVTIYLSMILFGVILTGLSTFLSMRKYLDADIDQLYE
ncbi:MAG: permease-like cell division protein FtsX [bacterium]|nr:permease-like cell division protein FtsX [Candidatus Limimorpha caballi]